MNRNADRERHLQDFLDGVIDEDELRRRLGAPADTSARVAEVETELRAYRAVWESLEREPDSRLPPEFARRTARAALAERRREAGGDRWMAALLAGSSAAAATAAVAAVVLLVSGSGLEVGRILGNALAASGQTPAALGGTLGAGALLYALDRYLSRGGRLRGSGT